MSLRGVYVVTVTPFTRDGKVDLAGIEKNADWLVKQGVHGLLPLGGTGEFASLEEEDKKAIVDRVLKTVAGRVPVVVGATAETTDKAIRNARYAESAGAAGVLVVIGRSSRYQASTRMVPRSIPIPQVKGIRPASVGVTVTAVRSPVGR